MQRVSVWLLTRTGRVVLATAGLMTLLALQPESVRFAQSASPPSAIASAGAARTLSLSAQARRFLTLQYRSFPTEFMGCMIGEVLGQTVIVRRIGPADVDPPQSTEPHRDRRLAWHHRRAGVYHSDVKRQPLQPIFLLLLSLALITAAPPFAPAQQDSARILPVQQDSARLSGSVRSSLNGLPISGVMIAVQGSRVFDVSNFVGLYALAGLRA